MHFSINEMHKKYVTLNIYSPHMTPPRDICPFKLLLQDSQSTAPSSTPQTRENYRHTHQHCSMCRGHTPVKEGPQPDVRIGGWGQPQISTT